MSLPPELDIGRDDGLTRERWERTMGWISAKIRALETVQPSWEAAVNELRLFGLVRLDNAIQPVYDRLVAIGQLGALFRATSATSLAVGTGIKVLAIAEAEREAFAAAAFLGVQKAGDPTVAMWGALQSYDRDTGLLTVLVEQAIGEGSHAAWEIFPTVSPDAAHAGRTDNPHDVTPVQIGAPTSGEMASAIADAVSGVRGGASINYNTLKKLEDLLAPILAGADSAYDTFAEIYAYITSDIDAGVAVNAALTHRVRVDAAQGLDATQQGQARSNIYAAPFDAMAYHGLQINGFQQVSQQHGSDAVTTNASYPTDQDRLGISGTFAVSAKRVAAPFTSRPDIPYGIEVEATSGASLSAGDHCLLGQHVEGSRAGRLRFGSAAAVPLSIGRMVRANVSGRGYVAIRNSATNRSYYLPFDVVADTDTWITVTIPGDTSGTWLDDTGVGLRVDWILAAGSAYRGTSGVWESSNKIAASDISNFMSATGRKVWFGPMVILAGIYLPTSEQIMRCQRHYDDEMRACQRYFQNLSIVRLTTVSGATQPIFLLPVPMRASPTITFSPADNGNWTVMGTNTGIRQSSPASDFGGTTLTLNARL